MAGAPIMWDRVSPGYSEYLAGAIQQHQDIEQCLASRDLNALAGQHSCSGAADPCKIEPYKFDGPGRDDHHVNELKQGADSAREEDRQSAATAKAEIQAVVDGDAARNLQALAANLTLVQNDEIDGVRAASTSLEEIVSPEPGKRKGREDVLRATFSPTEVDSMQPDSKSKAYKEVRSRRISHRGEIAFSAARTLQGDALWGSALNESRQARQQVLKRQSFVQVLQQRSQTATDKKHEINKIEDQLTESLGLGQQKLEQCRAHKAQVCTALDNKRVSFKAALKKVCEEDQSYKDVHIEHEAARIQIQTLEESIQRTQARLQAAQAASTSAREACDLWQQNTMRESQQLQELINNQARECVERADATMKVAASSAKVATVFLSNLLEENSSEVACVQADISANQCKLEQLQAQMVAEEPDQDIVDIESDLALRSDQHQCYSNSMERCESMRANLEDAMRMANERWSQLLSHQAEMQSTINMDTICQEAHGLADGCYKKYQLWKKGASRSSFLSSARPGSSGDSDALVTLDPRTQEFIERLIEQKAEQKAEEKLLQFQADQLFRRPGSVASDADSWTQLPPEAAASSGEANANP